MVSIRRVLCPVDFSEPSRQALQYGAELARKFGAELVLVHVIQPPAYPTSRFASLTGFPDLHVEVRRRVAADLTELRSQLGPELAVRSEVREGTPYEEILAVGKELDCDLIVMSTHGHTGLVRALLGSTAERVVRLSPIPVLTTRLHGGE